MNDSAYESALQQPVTGNGSSIYNQYINPTGKSKRSSGGGASLERDVYCQPPPRGATRTCSLNLLLLWPDLYSFHVRFSRVLLQLGVGIHGWYDTTTIMIRLSPNFSPSTKGDPPDEVACSPPDTQTCVRVGPNIAVPTDAKSSGACTGASLPSTLVPGAWASGITLSAQHAPRTSLGGGKVVVSQVHASAVTVRSSKS